MLFTWDKESFSVIFFQRLQKNVKRIVATEWNHARSRVHVSFYEIDTFPLIIAFLYYS